MSMRTRRVVDRITPAAGGPTLEAAELIGQDAGGEEQAVHSERIGGGLPVRPVPSVPFPRSDQRRTRFFTPASQVVICARAHMR
jgi:hypothetical protein